MPSFLWEWRHTLPASACTALGHVGLRPLQPSNLSPLAPLRLLCVPVPVHMGVCVPGCLCTWVCACAHGVGIDFGRPCRQSTRNRPCLRTFRPEQRVLQMARTQVDAAPLNKQLLFVVGRGSEDAGAVFLAVESACATLRPPRRAGRPCPREQTGQPPIRRPLAAVSVCRRGDARRLHTAPCKIRTSLRTPPRCPGPGEASSHKTMDPATRRAACSCRRHRMPAPAHTAASHIWTQSGTPCTRPGALWQSPRSSATQQASSTSAALKHAPDIMRFGHHTVESCQLAAA